MDKHIIQLKVRAWGCKIKSKIQANLTAENPEIKQGDDLNLRLVINFDPDDLPTSLEVSQDQVKQGPEFILKDPIHLDITDPVLELDITLEYASGETGEYNIEAVFRQAEFGTQLVEIPYVTFKLITPEVEIVYCRTNKPRISKGNDIDVQVGINSPSPQKLRGIVFGRLISNDDLVHRMYELEPKRISLVGEKEIVWHLTIPRDETKTGSFKAIIEFKSKDTFSKKEYDRFIEVRQSRLLRVNSLIGSKDVVSAGDELTISVELENVGLEKVDLEIYPEFNLSSPGKKSKDRNLAKQVQWSLPPQAITFEPDAKNKLSWPWIVPEEILNGRYLVNLQWKDTNTGEVDNYSQELFEVKKHHELEIVNAIAAEDSFSPGTEALTKILLSDMGTRAGDEIEIEFKILDFLNQEVYRITEKIGISKQPTEYNFIWQIPDDLEGGKYDVITQLLPADGEVISRRFSKILNIELPVKLDLHLMLPGISKPGLEVSQYLLQNEEVVKKINYKKLTIYQLNSNTHLFLYDNKLINYSHYKKSPLSELQPFSKTLFSYLITKQFLSRNKLKQDLEYWSKLGFSWVNLLLLDTGYIKIPSSKTMGGSSKSRISSTTWMNFAEELFKDFITTSPIGQLKLNKIFHGSIIKNKAIITTSDFKLINGYLNYLSGRDSKNDIESIQIISDLKLLFNTANKFRLVSNSKQLQKKFNKILNKWLTEIRIGQIRRHPDKNKFQAFRSLYSYVLLYLVSEIITILKDIKQNNYASPLKFSKLSQLEMIYYFLLGRYYHAQAEFDTGLSQVEIRNCSEDLNRAINEIKKTMQTFWYFNLDWQIAYSNYLKNMGKRTDLAILSEHVKITTNPVILRGIRGNNNNGKLILGNNGPQAIALNAFLALPSKHWTLVEPEANFTNNLYNLKRIMIPSKQVKEIPLTITFPRSLSFSNYKAILKLNPKAIKLLIEIGQLVK